MKWLIILILCSSCVFNPTIRAKKKLEKLLLKNPELLNSKIDSNIVFKFDTIISNSKSVEKSFKITQDSIFKVKVGKVSALVKVSSDSLKITLNESSDTIVNKTVIKEIRSKETLTTNITTWDILVEKYYKYSTIISVLLFIILLLFISQQIIKRL